MNQQQQVPATFGQKPIRVAVALALLLLSGCAVQTGDNLALVQAEINSISPTPLVLIKDAAQQQQTQQRVSSLLAQPLSLDGAIELAVLNNQRIQAQLLGLGVSAAELQQMSMLPNPGIKLTRGTGGEGYSTELEFGFNILHILTLPKVRAIELQQFQLSRLEVAQHIGDIINETKIAYWHAVAARETLNYVEKVQTSTEAAAELARRLASVGNFSKLDYLREQSLLSDATLNLLHAKMEVAATAEKLSQLLGLWQPGQQLQLPDRLPEIPAQLAPIQQLEQRALDQRLDVKLAKQQLSLLANRLGLTQSSRLVNAFEVEVARNLQHSEERSYSLIFELPIFDWGSNRVEQAQLQYQQAFAEATAVGIEARADLRTNYLNYRAMYDIAWHYKTNVLPLQQQIAEENQLRYNGMFISVFELIDDARTQMAAVTAYVSANRDFWIAKADLDLAMIGTPDATVLVPAAAAAEPAPAAPDHSKMGH